MLHNKSLLSSRAMQPVRFCTSCTAAAAHSSPGAPKLLQGLSEVLGPGSRYKALLLDQYGVLHDGKKPYSGAIAACAAAHAQGLQLFVISNSSRRASGTISKLSKMGFDSSHFAGAITSGELAHRQLGSRPDSWWQGLGHRCLHTTWSSRGSINLEGLDLEIVSEPEQASFILAHGTEAISVPSSNGGVAVEDRSLEQLFEMLEACARLPHPPPMVVANPDMVTTSGKDLIPMPGTLAKKYASLNARCQVRLCGKPDPIIYNACQDALTLDPSQVLAVGDSLEHDIAGASAAGIDSLFIAGGIHQAEVWQGGIGINMQALEALSSKHQTQPTYIAHQLQW